MSVWADHHGDGAMNAPLAHEQAMLALDAAEARVKRLEEVLRSLTNEVTGLLGRDEVGLRELIGNTNYSVLRDRHFGARAALAGKEEGEG